MDLGTYKLDAADYGVIARLHCEQINQGFLATLGVPFLELLYESIDNDSDSFLLVERVDGRVIGFVSGANGLGRIYKQLLMRPIRLIRALIHCLLSPSKIYKILEVLFLSKDTNAAIDLPKPELLSIVVDPAFQGGGHAERLFKALCVNFREAGVESFRIVVGCSLARANAFYKRLGCVAVKRIQVHKGIESLVYIKECS